MCAPPCRFTSQTLWKADQIYIVQLEVEPVESWIALRACLPEFLYLSLSVVPPVLSIFWGFLFRLLDNEVVLFDHALLLASRTALTSGKIETKTMGYVTCLHGITVLPIRKIGFFFRILVPAESGSQCYC